MLNYFSYFLLFIQIIFIHLTLFYFFSTIWQTFHHMRYGSIRPWEPEIYSDLILRTDSFFGWFIMVWYLPSPSSSQSSSQSSVSGVCPLVGCERRDLQLVRSAFPPASQPPSVCFRHWCSPCDTYGRFSSPEGPRGQRLKFNNSQLSSREVQQLFIWAKTLSSFHLTNQFCCPYQKRSFVM